MAQSTTGSTGSANSKAGGVGRGLAQGVSTELTKLVNRPAVWILGIVFLLLLVFLGYFLNYLIITGQEGDPPTEAVSGLLPEQFLATALTGFTGIGGAIVLILGAMSVGGEYGWETFKAALTQGSGRIELFAGKLIALAVVLLVFSFVTLGAGAASSYVIARLLEESVSWPAFFEIVKAAGAGWLILGVFCGLGVVLATLFRGTALAIGLGLTYFLLIASIINGFAGQSDAANNIDKALPYRNALDLGRAFGDLGQGAAAQVPGVSVVDPTQASLVLGTYLVGFVVISLALFKIRDVV